MRIIHSKVSGDCGGGCSISPPYPKISRPTKHEKLYMADLAIYVYNDGTIEVGKNRNGNIGPATVEDATFYFSKILAELKLKDTQLKMFKEGLIELLYEAITNVLKGDFHERTVCAESRRNGLDCNRCT